MKNSWMLKPGERLYEGTQMEDTISNYVQQNKEKRLLITNDMDGTIYFVEIDINGIMRTADVSMLYQGEYKLLPTEMAKDLAEAHLVHINLLSKAFDYLQALE